MSSNQPVILLSIANPKGDLTNVGEEFNQILGTLEATLCKVVPRPYARLEDIIKAIQDHRDQMVVFHFGGHANELGLLLETTQGGMLALAGGLAKVLSAQDSLRLVVLNGCSTERQIQAFHDAGVPAVIGTKQPIPDTGAARFAGWFYRSLATGATLEQAFTEAVGALESLPQDHWRDFLTQNKVAQDLKPSELWLLSTKDKPSGEWSLATALDDPLFGLPPLPQHDLPPKPYKHLSYFTEAEAELFFGRGWETRDLFFRVTTPSSDPILLLYGQSGVGKSSLLDAGLTPRLRAKNYEVLYLRRDPGKGLLGTLLAGLKAGLEQRGMKLGDLELSPKDLWLTLEHALGKPLVVILDQLEEAYTRSPSPKEAQAELTQLAESLHALFSQRNERPKGKLILSFRKEWLAEIETALAPNAAFLSKLRPLEALGLEGIEQAILGPTQSQRLRDKYNLEIAPDLPEEMAPDLLDRRSPIAPTLQLTLTKMWDKASDWDEKGKRANKLPPYKFDQDLYQDFHKKDLGEILDIQLGELEKTHAEESKSGLVLDLLYLHTNKFGAVQKTEQEVLEEYGEKRVDTVKGLVQAAKDAYLLSDPPGSDLRATRLSHDTLAPYVRERFEKSEKPGPRAKRILESRAVDWRPGKKRAPLDVYDLAIVEQGLAGTRKLDHVENKLLTASRAKRRQNQIVSRAVVSALVVLVILSVFFGYQSNLRAAEAERRRMVSIAQGLAARASALSNDSSQFTLATLLAEQAFQMHQRNGKGGHRQIDNSRRSLLSNKPLFRGESLLGYEFSVNSVVYSPDRSQLASGSSDKTIRVWDTKNSKAEPLVLRGHQGFVLSVAYSPDGSQLASGSDDSTIRVWDMKNPKTEPLVLLRHRGWVNSVAYSPDGSRLASGSGDKSIRLWRTPETLSAEIACWVLTRNLSQDEWNQYIGTDIPYEKTCSNLPIGEGGVQELQATR